MIPAMQKIGSCICAHRRLLILILTPLIAAILPLAAGDKYQSEAKCAFVVVIMAVFWTTEVVPLPITAFLPALLFPPLGLISARDIAPIYLSDVNLLFIGGLMMAVAIEEWKLHHRVALRFMLLVGTQTHWMMVGFMVPAWFLSMWISNTATAAMMVPIVGAVVNKLGLKSASDVEGRHRQGSLELDNVKVNSSTNLQAAVAEADDAAVHNNEEPLHQVNGKTNGHVKASLADSERDSAPPPEINDDPVDTDMAIEKDEATALALCIAYGASIGGIGTLTGSPPNVILGSRVDAFFGEFDQDSNVTFGTWMLLAIPCSLLCLFIGWFWLCVVFLGPRTFCKKTNKKRSRVINGIISKNYNDLGPISFVTLRVRIPFAEIMLLIVFCCLAVLWFTRAPGIFPGWAVWFTYGHLIRDSTVAVAVGFSLFLLPSSNPIKGPTRPLLEWNAVSTKLPWGVVWLLGGGFALAATVKSSGLSLWVSAVLEKAIGGLARAPMIFVLSIVTASLTEVTSNTATATMLIEILNDTARTLDMNPLLLLFPATISCSFAFMLPAATPPNAIVFATGFVRVIDMIKAGIGMNCWCVCVTTLTVLVWGPVIFDLDSKPWDGAILSTTTTQAPFACTYNATLDECLKYTN